MLPLSHTSRRSARSAMTLIELLVVVTIGVLLLATAVPLMRPAIRDAQLRESARQLNVMCAMAKARARELGRPAGIWIERSTAGGNAAFEIHMAETPPPYMGDFVDAVAHVIDDNGSGVLDSAASQILIPIAESASLHIPADPTRSLVHPGDFIQFNHQGPLYPILSVPVVAGPYFRINIFPVPAGVSRPAVTSPSANPAPTRPGVPYTIFRQPIKSPLKSVQFSGGSVIDLEHSGIGIDVSGTHPLAAFFDARYTNVTGNLNHQPVIIMFEPGGSVSRVYTRYNTNPAAGPPVLVDGGQRATGTIYLLIGKFEQTTTAPVMLADPTADPSNLSDLSNVWLAIGTLTGTVTTAENLGGNLVTAREIARTAQAMGGN